MQTIPYSESQGWFARIMEAAERDHEPIAITREGQQRVVLMAADDYASIEETLHLLSTPANAERIRRGLADYAKGNFQPGELCD